MTEKKINFIKELIKDLDINFLNREEFEKKFMNLSINGIKEEMWKFYCFAVDVSLTMEDVQC